jgi:hypothetical protein
VIVTVQVRPSSPVCELVFFGGERCREQQRDGGNRERAHEDASSFARPHMPIPHASVNHPVRLSRSVSSQSRRRFRRIGTYYRCRWFDEYNNAETAMNLELTRGIGEQYMRYSRFV